MRAEQKRAFAPEFESDVLDEMSLVDNIITESIDDKIPLVMDLSMNIS